MIVVKSQLPLLPKLHNNILDVSFQHYYEIKKAYTDILGLFHIDHLSINIANPSHEIFFLSCTPSTGYNICKGNLWLFDRTISPQWYANKDFYFWEEAYVEKYAGLIANAKHFPHQFKSGFVFVKKIRDYHIMYSYATKSTLDDKKLFLEKNKDAYLNMGEHCYKKVKHIYDSYYPEEPAPEIISVTQKHLKLVAKNE